jgi:AcrR family transcriptional regulator
MARRTKEEAAQTRRTILDAARLEFATQGYASASIADIADRTHLTHGALYHHFATKEALFRAVFEAVTADLDLAVIGAALEGQDPLDQFTRGCRAVLEHMTSDEYRQIAIADAPSVLGIDEWRSIDSAVGLRTTINGLEALQESGLLPRGDAGALGVLIYGGLTEAGMQLAQPEPLLTIDAAVEGVVSVIKAMQSLDKLP